jgi:hypothetical protein
LASNALSLHQSSAPTVFLLCRFPAGLKNHDFQGIFGYKVGLTALATHCIHQPGPARAAHAGGFLKIALKPSRIGHLDQ